MLPPPHSPRQNHLLAALPDAEFERLLPNLQLVPMPLGEAIYEPGIMRRYVYFPADAILSLLYILADGASTEIALIGHEGMLGTSFLNGVDATPDWTVVLSAGYGYRLQGQLLLREFNRDETLRSLLLHYSQALITQMTQTAVCNRHHSVEQQLCRLLLLILDRLSSDRLTMTQELLANMLGVRREGVTEAAGHLQHAGLIRYSRGHIEVLDRSGLEQAVCECYAVVKRESARLLANISRGDAFHIQGQSRLKTDLPATVGSGSSAADSTRGCPRHATTRKVAELIH